MSNLVCTIELDKLPDNGIFIEVKDKGSVKRHIRLNKDAITLTTEDDSNKSVITQKPDSIELDVKDGPSNIKMEKEKIAIHCKQFELKADEGIKVTAEKDISVSGQKGITVSAQKDIKFSTQAKFAIDSLQNTSISAKQAVNLDAKTNVAITAAINFSAKGNAKAEMEGALSLVKGQLVKLG